MSQIGLDFNAVKAESEVLALEPFNSTKKRAGVATKLSENHQVVHWKGAAEMILAGCTHVADGNGSVEEMSGNGVSRRSKFCFGNMSTNELLLARVQTAVKQAAIRPACAIKFRY